MGVTMSRHEMIRMFELVMKALLILIRNSSTFPRDEWEIENAFTKFMEDLKFKPED